MELVRFTFSFQFLFTISAIHHNSHDTGMTPKWCAAALGAYVLGQFATLRPEFVRKEHGSEVRPASAERKPASVLQPRKKTGTITTECSSRTRLSSVAKALTCMELSCM